jgi:hypothetical protein
VEDSQPVYQRPGHKYSSVEENTFLNLLATNGTLGHAIATHLTRAVSTEEDHVLEPVETYRTHGLFLDVLQLLL